MPGILWSQFKFEDFFKYLFVDFIQTKTYHFYISCDLCHFLTLADDSCLYSAVRVRLKKENASCTPLLDVLMRNSFWHLVLIDVLKTWKTLWNEKLCRLFWKTVWIKKLCRSFDSVFLTTRTLRPLEIGT